MRCACLWSCVAAPADCRASSVQPNPRHSVVRIVGLRSPTGIEVGHYNLESAVQEKWFSR